MKEIIENELLELMGKKLIHDYEINTTLNGFKLIVYIILNYNIIVYNNSIETKEINSIYFNLLNI